MSLDDRATRVLLSQLRYYSARLGQDSARALLEAQRAANMTAAEKAIRSGDYPAALEALFPAASRAALASALNVSAIRVMLASASRAMRNDVPAVLRTKLNGPTPAVIDALQRLDLQRVAPLVKGSEEAVRAVLHIGLTEGMHPVDVARWGREAIGLTPYDIELVSSFDAMLNGAPQDAIRRTLRDARFDATLRAAAEGRKTLTRQMIAKQRDGYVRGLHAWRAETFTRTTTLDALKQGQRMAWFDAAEAAGVDRGQLVKTWITTLDGRERPEHHDAHGLTVSADAQFPVDGGVDVPGENVYNCRCAFTIRLLPAGRASARAFLAQRGARFAAQRSA